MQDTNYSMSWSLAAPQPQFRISGEAKIACQAMREASLLLRWAILLRSYGTVDNFPCRTSVCARQLRCLSNCRSGKFWGMDCGDWGAVFFTLSVAQVKFMSRILEFWVYFRSQLLYLVQILFSNFCLPEVHLGLLGYCSVVCKHDKL